MLSVLFVCTGNICRSPIAEALLMSRSRDLGVQLSVRSAGTWAQPGNSASRGAVTAAGEMGLDLEAHQATPLSGRLVSEADLILGLAREHRDEVLELVPDAAPRTFTLKELAALLADLPPLPVHTDGDAAIARIADAHRLRGSSSESMHLDMDVPDPIGSGLFAYREVSWDVAVALDGVLAGLFGSGREAGSVAAADEG